MDTEERYVFQKDLDQKVKRFKSIYKDSIKREGADKLLEWLQGSDFFTAPASTRFHGCYEGGLLRHSLNVYDCLLKQLEAAGLSDVYPQETLVIIALLHDVCKVNYYKIGYRNVKDENGKWYAKEVYEIDEKFLGGDHADKSIIILQNFIHLSTDEILAIRAHMGGWDTTVRGGGSVIGKIFDNNKLAVCLHLADMMATYIMEG